MCDVTLHDPVTQRYCILLRHWSTLDQECQAGNRRTEHLPGVEVACGIVSDWSPHLTTLISADATLNSAFV